MRTLVLWLQPIRGQGLRHLLRHIGRKLVVLLVSVLMLNSIGDATAVPSWIDLGSGTSPAVALNRYRYPVIAYTNGSLYVAICSDLTCPSASNSAIPGTSASAQPALVLTASDLPVISYYNSASRDLMLVVCSTSTCTSATVSVIDSAGDVGQYSSIRLTSSGLPVISYYDATNRDLKAVFCGNLACTSRTLQRIDYARDVGQFTSLQLNGNNRAVISYYNATNRRLQLAVCTNLACSNPTIVTVDNSGNVGQYTSLALMSNGRPVISYYDVTRGDLKLAICNAATCSNPTLRTVDSSGTVGQYTALTLDYNDVATISYYANSWGVARLAVCQNALCNSRQLLDMGGGVASITAVMRRNPQGVYVLYANSLRHVVLYTDIPTPVGCRLDAPAVVNDGDAFTVTVRCDGLTAEVYGFEIGLQAPSSLRASSSSFAPGTFVNAVGTNILIGVNRLDRYAVSRRSPANASTGSFSLGSVEYIAPQVRSTTSVTITLSPILLGNRLGAQLTVPFSSAATITVRNSA
ncbi:MAG: hypothetical protein IPO91_03325 [Chloroflexi bacterium]|nr:hypothetical protein [Chloroflexota bacterium]